MEAGGENEPHGLPSEFEYHPEWKRVPVLPPELEQFREDLASLFIKPDEWQPTATYISDSLRDVHPHIAFVFSNPQLAQRKRSFFRGSSFPPLQEVVRPPLEQFKTLPPEFSWQYFSVYKIKRQSGMLGKLPGNVKRSARFFPRRMGQMIGYDMVESARNSRNEEDLLRERLRLFEELAIPYTLNSLEVRPVFHVKDKNGEIENLEEDSSQIVIEARFDDVEGWLKSQIRYVKEPSKFATKEELDRNSADLEKLEESLGRVQELPDPFAIP